MVYSDMKAVIDTVVAWKCMIISFEENNVSYDRELYKKLLDWKWLALQKWQTQYQLFQMHKTAYKGSTSVKQKSWLVMYPSTETTFLVNSLRLRRNRRHFTDDIFKCIFLNEHVWISITVSLKFVPKGPVNNIPALVQIMAWRRPGNKPLSEPMMIISLTHICITRPQWVNEPWYLVTHSNGDNII